MPCRSRNGSTLASRAVVSALVAISPASSLACGYHDDVTLARGLMNWIYPDALHVTGAIAKAVAERQLPPPRIQGTTPDPFGLRYRATVKSLERVEEVLRPSLEEPSLQSLAFLLLEPMLWTRFEVVRDELRAQVHVAGPQPGDLVLISGEIVISELAERRLAIGEAHRLGLIRLYGREDQKARFLATCKNAGREGVGSPNAPDGIRTTGEEQ